MIFFAALALALALLALLLVLPPLWRSHRLGGASTGGRNANLTILREQLAQLDAELASGLLDASQHAEARADIARRVLEEEAQPQATPLARGARGTAYALALALPVFAVLVYGQLGNVEALLPQAERQVSEEVTIQMVYWVLRT